MALGSVPGVVLSDTASLGKVAHSSRIQHVHNHCSAMGYNTLVMQWWGGSGRLARSIGCVVTAAAKCLGWLVDGTVRAACRMS